MTIDKKDQEFYAWLRERADATLNVPQSPLLELSAMMPRVGLLHELETAQFVGGENFGAFSLFAGIDNLGRPCLWILNEDPEGLSIAIPLSRESIH